jgi:Uncharacterized membrane protein, required for colicin V production
MFWLDIVLIACLLIGIIKGLIDGLIKQVIALLALILAVFLSGTVATWLRDLANEYLGIGNADSPFVLNAIFYLLAFVIILSVLIFLGKIVSKAINYTPIGPVNKIFGAIFGGFITLLSLSILLNVLAVFDSKSMLITKQTQEKSGYYSKVKDVFPQVYPYVKEFFKN